MAKFSGLRALVSYQSVSHISVVKLPLRKFAYATRCEPQNPFSLFAKLLQYIQRSHLQMTSANKIKDFLWNIYFLPHHLTWISPVGFL